MPALASRSPLSALDEIRATLRDTRKPTRPSSSFSSRPRHSSSIPAPAPGQRFVRQRTVDRKMKRQLKKQGLARQWKHTQRQRAAEDEQSDEQSQRQEDKQSEQSSTRRRKNAAAATAAAPIKRHKADTSHASTQPALTSSTTRFFSLLSNPTFTTHSSSSSSYSNPSTTLDHLDLHYLEAKLGLSGQASQSRSRLRREMAMDGLDGLFELVEGIETGMTEAQKRRVMREEGIGEDEYAEMMEAAASAQGGAAGKRKRRRGQEWPEDGDGDEVEAEEGGKDEDGGEDEDGDEDVEGDEDEDQLMPKPDEDEMERYYKEDEEKELAADELSDAREADEQESEDDTPESEDNEEEEDQDEGAEEDGDDASELSETADDKPTHRKLTRDELYGFNAPTPQSLIDYKKGEQTLTTTSSTTATSNSSTTPTKYIPPHLRNKTPLTASTTAPTAPTTAAPALLSIHAADATLLPRITGLLNRLNEQNVEPIAAQLHALYGSHAQAAVNGTLVVGVLTALVGGGVAASLARTFVVSVSGLMFLVHYTEEQGTVPYMLEHTLLTLHNVLSAASTAAPTPALTAAGVNLVEFLCHLYLFGVTSSTALFDLLTLFSTTLTPLHIELLTTVLATTGTQLRKQDPTALKQTILTLHRIAAQLTDAERAGRVGYLLGLVSDVKNNRTRPSQGAVDSVAPLLNGLLNVVKRRMGKRVGFDESRRLTFGYEDVRRIGERGRWWIVGAAYKGKGESEQKDVAGVVERKAEEESVVDEEGDINYVQLARQQGYHLPFDIRVFCILLSSVDYLQAVEAIDKLNIRQGSQWRSVIAIIIDCVRRTRTYNPYFALVTLPLCQYVRPVRFTLQLALWDTFTTLSTLPHTVLPSPSQQAASIGRYVAQLLQSPHGPTPWAVWKHIAWQDGALHGAMLECVRAAVDGVLGVEGRRGEEGVRFVFGGGKRGREGADVGVEETGKRGRKGGDGGEEERVRDGLLMFLSKYVEPAETRKGKKKDEKAELIAKRVKIAKEALADAL